MTDGAPIRVFDLLNGVSARDRQAFGAERQRRRSREGVREELLQDKRGKWYFAYFFGDRKFDELRPPARKRA